jgi:uncharacterized protein (TIGR02118 family)
MVRRNRLKEKKPLTSRRLQADARADCTPSPSCIYFIAWLYSAGLSRPNPHLFIHSSFLYRMTKLIALYRKPADPVEFDKHYFEVHTPLVKKYPGLRKLEITRVTGAPIGETKFHILCEMYFDNKDAMDAALSSTEGKAVARDLMSFAAEYVTVFVGESE